MQGADLILLSIKCQVLDGNGTIRINFGMTGNAPKQSYLFTRSSIILTAVLTR
jgi:hypothetical protein